MTNRDSATAETAAAIDPALNSRIEYVRTALAMIAELITAMYQTVTIIESAGKGPTSPEIATVTAQLEKITTALIAAGSEGKGGKPNGIILSAHQRLERNANRLIAAGIAATDKGSDDYLAMIVAQLSTEIEKVQSQQGDTVEDDQREEDDS